MEKRKFCDENEIVVGTPILQLYYNNKMLKLRFGKKKLPNEKAEKVETRLTNVYIGQLHSYAIQALVNITLTAIKVRL